MSNNLQSLIDDSRTLVEALKRKGSYDGFMRLLTDLYPDNAHFIYELLQNAEDACASEVSFNLKDDGVEFRHNGACLFSFENVKAITNIGVSTKREDHTSIGKFGIGFKSVFAYTATPEIESGEFHFRIWNMIVPDTEGLSHGKLGEKVTRFNFPFNNPEKPTKKARSEIERNLMELNENTLLFLSNIRKIEYSLPNSTKGFLERIELGNYRINISVQHPEDQKVILKSFLRFEKIVKVNDEKRELKSCRIAIAFTLGKNYDMEDEKGQLKIIPTQAGQVCIYFPAIKEISNLKFHLHAPFASTVARDSVRDCQANNKLCEHLANLIAESMTVIRDQGLLTVEFLATLPNNKDNLSLFYKPILDKLIDRFKNEKFTPMKMGGHAAASRIFRGSARLSSLITDNDLATILGKTYYPPMWVAHPAQRNQREDNFLSVLNISEWKIEDLVTELSNRPHQIITKWLSEKTDEWYQELYALLGEYMSDSPRDYREQIKREESLKSLRIIRLSNGVYSIGKECYFPSEGIEHDKIMPRVCKATYTSGKHEQQRKKAKDFLIAIGVKEVTEATEIEMLLKQNYSTESVNSGRFSPRIEDIKRFISFLEKDQSKKNIFNDYPIFQVGNGEWRKAKSVYLDEPYLDTGLSAYFKLLGLVDSYSLNKSYLEISALKPEQIGKFAEATGAKISLEVNLTECSENPNWEYLQRVPGQKNTSPIDQDYTIKPIERLLRNPNEDLARLIWKTMHLWKDKYTEAIYQKNEANGYREAPSQLACHLKKAAWIPQKNGESLIFVKPCDATPGNLPSGFSVVTSNKWLEVIEFGSTAKEETEEYVTKNVIAQQIGYHSLEEAEEVARLKKEDPEGFKKWKEKANLKKPDFPNRPIINSERRQNKIREQIANAPSKEYETRGRSVRTSNGGIDPKTKLKEEYTNENGQMVCQICKEEMPFRKRDGEYYFEAVEAFTETYLPKEQEAQYLALCPLCSAKYKEFVKKDDSAMSKLKDCIINSSRHEIPIVLDEKTSLHFEPTHFDDISNILQESFEDQIRL